MELPLPVHIGKMGPPLLYSKKESRLITLRPILKKKIKPSGHDLSKSLITTTTSTGYT